MYCNMRLAHVTCHDWPTSLTITTLTTPTHAKYYNNCNVDYLSTSVLLEIWEKLDLKYLCFFVIFLCDFVKLFWCVWYFKIILLLQWEAAAGWSECVVAGWSAAAGAAGWLHSLSRDHSCLQLPVTKVTIIPFILSSLVSFLSPKWLKKHNVYFVSVSIVTVESLIL